MSNSASNLDLISQSQANKEVTLNAALDAASPAMLYGRRALATAGLTWGYYGGTISIAGTPTQIANGTVTLAASSTNYVEADQTTGTVSVNQTGFTAGKMPLYSVVTGASTVASYTDLRILGSGGVTAGDISDAIAAHEAESDPHPGYLMQTEGDARYDALGAAAAAISAHEAEADPHTQYLTQAEGDARYASATNAGVSSVNAKTGAVTLNATDVGADASGAASSAIAAHVAASDPHAQYALESTIGAANGIASLGSDGKLPASQLPNLAIIDFLGTAANQAAMLALSGQKGDWCARSDTSTVYVITGSDPTLIGSWTALSYPTGTGGTVTSVGLSTPGLLFDVAGSPVTGAGTLSLSLKNQAANMVLAGPVSGAAAAPTMRALTQADLPAQPFDLTAFYPGVPPASVRITRVPIARAVTFPANFAGSVGIASVAATASTAFDVRKNGTSVGTITFAAGATTATFTTSGAVSYAAGDYLSIVSPATPDATLADPGFVLAGSR